MMAKRLARQLGLDGNPLRRPTDRIATCLTALLVTVFLIGTPLLSIAAIGWVAHSGASMQQAPRSEYLVPAVLLQSSRAPSLEGHTVPLWVDAAGWPAGSPPRHPAVVAREAAVAVGATLALAIALLCLACGGRWVLDRRRLANWEAAWAAVGPQWTRRFRSRG